MALLLVSIVLYTCPLTAGLPAFIVQVPPTAWLTECLSKLQLYMAETAQQQQATEQQQQQRLGAPAAMQHADALDASQHLPDSILAAVQQRDWTSSSSSDSSSNAHAARSNMRSAHTTNTTSSTSNNGSGGGFSTAMGHTLSSQDFSNTIWALATLRIKPNADWMGVFLRSSAPSLATAAPQELVITLWGLQVREAF